MGVNFQESGLDLQRDPSQKNGSQFWDPLFMELPHLRGRKLLVDTGRQKPWKQQSGSTRRCMQLFGLFGCFHKLGLLFVGAFKVRTRYIYIYTYVDMGLHLGLLIFLNSQRMAESLQSRR